MSIIQPVFIGPPRVSDYFPGVSNSDLVKEFENDDVDSTGDHVENLWRTILHRNVLAEEPRIVKIVQNSLERLVKGDVDAWMDLFKIEPKVKKILAST
jgi:hypothetical protein